MRWELRKREKETKVNECEWVKKRSENSHPRVNENSFYVESLRNASKIYFVFLMTTMRFVEFLIFYLLCFDLLSIIWDFHLENDLNSWSTQLFFSHFHSNTTFWVEKRPSKLKWSNVRELMTRSMYTNNFQCVNISRVVWILTFHQSHASRLLFSLLTKPLSSLVDDVGWVFESSNYCFKSIWEW